MIKNQVKLTLLTICCLITQTSFSDEGLDAFKKARLIDDALVRSGLMALGTATGVTQSYKDPEKARVIFECVHLRSLPQIQNLMANTIISALTPKQLNDAAIMAESEIFFKMNRYILANYKEKQEKARSEKSVGDFILIYAKSKVASEDDEFKEVESFLNLKKEFDTALKNEGRKLYEPLLKIAAQTYVGCRGS